LLCAELCAEKGFALSGDEFLGSSQRKAAHISPLSAKEAALRAKRHDHGSLCAERDDCFALSGDDCFALRQDESCNNEKSQ